jgi:AcrR family transcriptional regulator
MSRGRPPAFDRDTALGQAMLVFWKHGYDTTSITALTDAMGINASSLYAAFGDKRSLFTAVVQHYLRGPASFTTVPLDEAPTAREAVERHLRAAAAVYTGPGHPPGCLVISGATNCAPHSTDVQAELRAIRAQGRRALEHRLSAGIRAHELPAGADARALAAFYSATLQGMSGLARDGATRTELDNVVTVALAAWPS